MAVGDRTFPLWSFRNPLRRAVVRPARLLEFCGPSPSETAADLGAGAGFFLDELRRRVGPAGRLFAVDVDGRALDLARHLLGGAEPPVLFLHASAASVPQIPTGAVDFVLSNGLLCCLVDKAGALDEMWRILRPGGRALLTFQTLAVGWTRRGRALRLTDEQFRALAGRRPWHITAGPHRTFGRVYRMDRPG
jgi:ubiquinone/menaquinone biosynthesis C-methylase UbiE